jgi:hypothetical protein
MDALGGYGSDSSSEEETPAKAVTQSSNSMVALLGEASSDDSDNGGANNTGKTPKPPAKRQKLEASKMMTNESPRPMLPAPPITATSGASMIHWDIDYLAQLSPINKDPHEMRTSKLAQKLEKLSRTVGSKKTWADHLKTQQEFHNPRFFQSVVDHFGIQRPLGSQAKYANSVALQDYEVDLFKSSSNNSSNNTSE